MSSCEFTEWMAFSQLEPWGEERADLRSALICKVLADINTPKDKQRMKLEDFVLKFDRKPQAQTTEEMIGAVAQISAIYAASDGEGVD